jgi:hypothetical protein
MSSVASTSTPYINAEDIARTKMGRSSSSISALGRETDVINPLDVPDGSKAMRPICCLLWYSEMILYPFVKC